MEETHPLSKHVLDTLKNGPLVPKITREDLINLDELLDKYHPYAGEPKYANKLYPIKIIEILLFSRSQHWPHPLNIDHILEHYLTRWYQTHLDKPVEYLKLLLEAVNEQQCTAGLFYRLNLDILTNIKPDTITISTAYGTIRHQTQVITKSFSNKSANILKDYGFYIDNIYELQATLESYGKAYTLEQALLSWVGYKIFKTMLEHDSQIPKLERTTNRITLK